LSWVNFSVTGTRYSFGTVLVSSRERQNRRVMMDEYQEEILDFHASEQDGVEPADDAIEM